MDLARWLSSRLATSKVRPAATYQRQPVRGRDNVAIVQAPPTRPVGRWEGCGAARVRALGAQNVLGREHGPHGQGTPPPGLPDQSSAGQMMEGTRGEWERKERQEGGAERKEKTERAKQREGEREGERNKKMQKERGDRGGEREERHSKAKKTGEKIERVGKGEEGRGRERKETKEGGKGRRKRTGSETDRCTVELYDRLPRKPLEGARVHPVS